MRAEMNEGLSISDLEIQKFGLEDRIRRLEADLKSPLEANFSEQAGQISNQIILKRLLEVERNNLRKVNFEIEKKKQGFLSR
jgi:hypothetical protein